jgi:hypothetical protein
MACPAGALNDESLSRREAVQVASPMSANWLSMRMKPHW